MKLQNSVTEITGWGLFWHSWVLAIRGALQASFSFDWYKHLALPADQSEFYYENSRNLMNWSFAEVWLNLSWIHTVSIGVWQLQLDFWINYNASHLNSTFWYSIGQTRPVGFGNLTMAKSKMTMAMSWFTLMTCHLTWPVTYSSQQYHHQDGWLLSQWQW